MRTALPAPEDVERDACRVGWRAFPRLLVRVPAVPASDLLSLRYTRALEAHRAARGHYAEIAVEGRRLADAITSLVPGAPSTVVRRGLLATRRAAFNARRLPREHHTFLAAAGDRELLSEMAAWERRFFAWEGRLARRDQLFEEDATHADARLVEALREPVVALSIAFLDQAVAEELARVGPGPIAALGAHERRVVGLGARVLWRTGLRPTPSGLLAATGTARLVSDRGQSQATLSGRVASVRPAHELLVALRDRALRSPAVLERALVRVRSDWVEADDGAHAELLARFADRGGEARSVAELVAAGSSHEDILAALRACVLELHLPVGRSPDDGLQDMQELTRLLWETVGSDLSLLAILEALEDHQDHLGEVRRACDAALAGTAPPVPPGAACQSPRAYPRAYRASIDTSLRDEIEVPVAGVAAFFDAVAEYGAGRVAPGPSLEEQVLARCFTLFYPGAAAVPVTRFHHDFQRFCAHLGISSSLWHNVSALAAAVGVAATNPAVAVRSEIEELLAGSAGEAAVVYQPRASTLQGWRPDVERRLALRFRPLLADGGPRRCLLNLWGGPWMTLLARYSNVSSPGGRRLQDEARAWMERWPDLVDMDVDLGRSVNRRPTLTRSALHLPGHWWAPGNLSVAELETVMAHDEARLELRIRGTRERVRPVFFGVSHARSLPGLAVFLMHLAGHGRSFLDTAFEAVNSVHVTRQSAQSVSRLPGICLSDSLMLSPEAFVVPAAALPKLATPVDRRGFFALHDWLDEHAIPSGFAQVRIGSEDREPLWLDLSHPEGVNALYRCARRGHPLTVYPQPAFETLSARSSEGRYEVEYYAELAAGSAIASPEPPQPAAAGTSSTPTPHHPTPAAARKSPHPAPDARGATDRRPLEGEATDA